MDAYVRHHQKLQHLAEVLVMFGFTSRRLFSEYLAVDYKGQSAFFKGLMAQQWCHRIQVPLVRSSLYLPTTRFLSIAGEFGLDTAGVNTRPSRISHELIRHTLMMQEVLNNESDGKGGATLSYVAEPSLGHVNEKRPDLIINDKLAIEVECTHKNNGRIYRGFVAHALAMRDGKYQQVKYVVTNRLLYEGLLKKFESPLWPVMVMNAHTGKLENVGEQQLQIEDELREQFSFECLEINL